MKLALRKRARAPHIARSFTVPLTANAPMSPPGKNSGRTTYESVVNASWPAPVSKTAPSCRAFEARAAERRHEQLLDELMHQPPAATVREQHVWILRDGDRAREPGRLVDFGFRRHGPGSRV